MIVFQAAIIILMVADIIYILRKRNHENQQRLYDEQQLVTANQRLTDASGDLLHIEKELFPLIDAQFGAQYAENIKEGIVQVGMPATFLTMAWGHPQRIEWDNDHKEEYWYYKEQEKSEVAQTKVTIRHQKVIKLKDF